jgi:large subunit ribosomal protein L4
MATTKITEKTKVAPKTKVSQVVAKVVRTVLSNSRHATAKTKKRGEISGGGKKPWKQKGTGRARVGSSRSPLWRGGGTVFGPSGNQNFNIKASKKEKALALAAAFEAKKSNTKTVEMPKLTKTKEAAEFMKKNELSGKVLVLLDVLKVKGEKQSAEIVSLKRAFRNIPEVSVKFKSEANAYDVFNHNSVAILTAKKTEAKKVEAKEAK